MGKYLHTFERTNYIEALLTEYNLNVMNDSSPTTTANNSETAIDLSFCSPSISFNFDWSVSRSPLDSDHGRRWGGGGGGRQIPLTFQSEGDILSFVPPTFFNLNISRNVKSLKNHY